MDDKEVQTNSQSSNEQVQEEVKLELAEYRNDKGEFDIDKLKQLDADKKYFRSQISKLRQMPESQEEYSKNFVFDSKFTEFLSDEDNKAKIDKVFDNLDKLSMEKGIGVEKNHDIRRFLLDEMVDNGIIDTVSKAEKEAKHLQAINDRNASVQEFIGEGTDRETWDNNLKTWLKSFCNSEGEYALHEKLINENATWALSMNKVRQALMGNTIPVIHSEASYNEEEWQRNFTKAVANNDIETQNKMLESRGKKILGK